MKILPTVIVSLALFSVVAATSAHAGSLAPAPRVVAKYERTFLERSGSQTLEELLDTGILRYFLTGGQSLLVLVDGRPYATTDGDLDSLPISAIERIELLSGESLGTLGGSAVRGALNVVLRNDLDGFETRSLARMPSREGGDGWQGSVFWGGEAGKGRMTIGADYFKRQEIASRSRDYSRSAWREGGAFNEAQNVSVGGNTVWVVQRDDKGEVTGVRSVALGDCDPAKGYTGPLGNPPGIRNGDKGCGFAYGAIMWETARYDQKSAVVNLDHPLGEDAELHLDARVVQSDWAFRYAPSVGSFSLAPNASLLQAINAAATAAGSDFQADGNDRVSVAHRFVGFGNRDWRTDGEEYDLSVGVEGRLTNWLGYDARLSALRAESFLTGDTFVHAGRIREEVEAGNYDLVNPFSTAPAHSQAIRNASLREEIDSSSEHLDARLALEGSGFAIGGRDAAWTAGVEAGTVDVHQLMVFRGHDGTTYPVSDVLGSGGVSYAGERKTVGAFAELSVPVSDKLDIRAGAHADEHDDIGRLNSWRLAAEYRPVDLVTLRSSWGEGDRPPSMSDLYSTEDQDHPYVDCDPGSGPPPRTCPESNPRQVTRTTTGNPDLDPSTSRRLAIGAEARRGPFFLGIEWYRLASSGGAGQHSADWAMQNLPECMGGDLTDCIERTGGDIAIRDSYANVVDSELTGITIRFGGGFRTGWGVVGMRGAWRRVTDAELRIAGEEDRLAIARNMVRVGFLARRGGLSAIWTANYRSGYENRAGTGEFDSWTGHDLVLDWTGPLGLEGARVAAGVFNLTDAGLSVDTSNPSSVDGPTEAGWGRTFFLTLNMRF